MELTALGFDGWVEEQAAPLLQPGQSLARVTAVDRGPSSCGIGTPRRTRNLRAGSVSNTEYHDLSYAEKRRKDRSFGRFIKSAKKGMKG
jgi:hypothetical protein